MTKTHDLESVDSIRSRYWHQLAEFLSSIFVCKYVIMRIIFLNE
jgi:hypothetical protein